ncbi:spore germination protein [Paenibacillus marchantiophytorum]|uniref:spore germination protein n=1 Tax=Paenibacillus marchantiophytorum TaxID=1619310 RepID=UPI001E473890|nr:spore germination protein [Paenibacillus marchantiophytorum]
MVHLASIKSFSVSYLSRVVPTFLSDWKDLLINVPRSWKRFVLDRNKKPSILKE